MNKIKKELFDKVFEELLIKNSIDAETLGYHEDSYNITQKEFQEVYSFLDEMSKNNRKDTSKDFIEDTAYFEYKNTMFVWWLVIGQGSHCELLIPKKGSVDNSMIINLDDTWNNLKSGSVIITPNQRCMNSCLFCPGLVDTTRSSTDIFKKAIQDCQYFIENEYDTVEISGSDPCQFIAIAEIVLFLKQNGIKKVQISCHGRTLKNKELVLKLKAAGLDYCRIPLYGSTSEIHNKMTQVDYKEGDAFNDTVEAIKNCAELNIKIAGHTIITEYNKDDLNAIVQLYKDLTNLKMKEMIISAPMLTYAEENYYKDWYIPIKDLNIKNIVDMHPDLGAVYFKVLDIPFCVYGEYTEKIENNSNKPDIGTASVKKNLQSDNPKIPKYRVKIHFEECEKCSVRDECSGIFKNDYEVFGSGELRAI